MIEKENGGFVYRDSGGQEVDPEELREALETALSHPEQPLSDFVWLFSIPAAADSSTDRPASIGARIAVERSKKQNCIVK